MNEPDWATLSHALGNSEDLPGILAELTPDPKAPVWGELWDRVYHQGDIFSASPHVLPYLLDAATSWPTPGRIMPLALASAIMASAGFSGSGLEETIAGLREIALGTVSALDISRSDRVWVMSSALVFGAELLWGPVVEHLNDEEFARVCPTCRRELYFAIGDAGYYTRNDFNENKNTRREAISPADPRHLRVEALWLHSVATLVADAELAKRILLLFGKTLCPACMSGVEIPASIELFERPAS